MCSRSGRNRLVILDSTPASSHLGKTEKNGAHRASAGAPKMLSSAGPLCAHAADGKPTSSSKPKIARSIAVVPILATGGRPASPAAETMRRYDQQIKRR